MHTDVSFLVWNKSKSADRKMGSLRSRGKPVHSSAVSLSSTAEYELDSSRSHLLDPLPVDGQCQVAPSARDSRSCCAISTTVPTNPAATAGHLRWDNSATLRIAPVEFSETLTLCILTRRLLQSFYTARPDSDVPSR